MKELSEMYLTRAEERVMLILWDLEEGLVKDVRNRFPDPKPARNTVSTVIRILERKGFVEHKVYGIVHLYYPVVSKQSYSISLLESLIENYFNNSFLAMTSQYAGEKNLTVKELDAIFDELKKGAKRRKKK